jgi:hypothetical protein
MGDSPWLSFAFWQWLAVAFLWLGLGHLLWSSRYAASPIGAPANLEVSPASDG